jgi:DNA polymerase III delta prime subunit
MTPFEHDGVRIAYKFIILDEADTLALDAQNALRRCIEIYSYNTRFCFMCNYISKITYPILSRCYVYYFKQVSMADACARLRYILSTEGMTCADELIEFAYAECRGDLREIITTFETYRSMYGPVVARDDLEESMLVAFTQDFWSDPQLHSRPLLEIEQQVYMQGVSVRRFIRSFLAWAYDSVPDDRLYPLSKILSKIEKHTLHSIDAHAAIALLLFWHRRISTGSSASKRAKKKSERIDSTTPRPLPPLSIPPAVIIADDCCSHSIDF